MLLFFFYLYIYIFIYIGAAAESAVGGGGVADQTRGDVATPAPSRDNRPEIMTSGGDVAILSENLPENAGECRWLLERIALYDQTFRQTWL